MYDRIIDLRIATPQIIINYAMYLEEHNYFEDSFKVREFNITFSVFSLLFCFGEFTYFRFNKSVYL